MQRKIHESSARFRVAAFGRQSGKSTFGINELMQEAWDRPGTTYWFLGPIFSAAEVQFKRMLLAYEDSGCFKKINHSKYSVILINGSTISFKSGDTMHRLRGDTLHGVVIDEVREQHPKLWTQVIRPMLATTGGWAIFISTPNGFDQFFDVYEKARLDKTGKWECFKAPSTCNPLFTQEEYDSAKQDCSEAEFDQEYNANFRDLTAGKAYVSYGEHNESMTSPFVETGNPSLYTQYLPIVVGMDFNLSPMSWTLGQFSSNKCYWFDEIHLYRSHTQEAALELVSRVKDHKAGIVICGDATSKSGQRAAAGQSDYDILTQILDHHKIPWVNKTPDSNPMVRDRVNTTNARLKSATGEVSILLHPLNCKYLKKDYERVVWKDSGTLDEGKESDLTHQSDGAGYTYCVLMPVKRNTEVGKMRIINR